MVDFDNLDDWHTRLTANLNHFLPDSTAAHLLASRPRYIEDACEILFELGDRDVLIDATLDWLRGDAIAGYHGSRLCEEDIASIQRQGLMPLAAIARRDRLARALSRHPRWPQVSSRLDEEIVRHGSGNFAGRREGQAHLTLSRHGLIDGFNHYLQYGAEFDQHVAHALLGSEGYDMLALDGRSTVIQFAVPGEAALAAAHPHFTIDDLRHNGDLPNIAGDFLQAWSYRLAHPDFQSHTLKVDCGMVFRNVVQAEWITCIEPVL